MSGTPPTHRAKIKPEGSERWIDIGPLWEKASGEFTGRADLPNSLDNVPIIIVKADRPKATAKPSTGEHPAA